MQDLIVKNVDVMGDSIKAAKDTNYFKIMLDFLWEHDILIVWTGSEVMKWVHALVDQNLIIPNIMKLK